MLMVGVISYLPNDERIRRVRWKTTKKCIENLIEVSSWIGETLHIVETGWREEEINEFWNRAVFHHVEAEKRGAAVSRNLLLKYLYSSQADYMLMCDDDAHIYPHYNIKAFLEALHREPEPFIKENLLHICAILGNSSPYKEANMGDKDFEQNWVFREGGDHAGRCPQIFANFNKFLGKGVYQREYLYNELHLGGEDGCFDLDLMKEGVMAYTLTAFIAGTTEITSSFWEEKKSKQDMFKDEVWEEGQATLDYIKREFPKVRQISKYRLDFRAYRPAHKKRILVPRKEAYVFTEKDIPKKRAKKRSLGLLK